MLVDRYPVVWVAATAGAGKTTAVVEAGRYIDRPIAWLTLDATDAAPGRLVTYLEAALTRRAPQVDGVGTGALARRIPHAEAAGLLAEAVGRARCCWSSTSSSAWPTPRRRWRCSAASSAMRRQPCAWCSSAGASWPSTWATPRPWAAWPPSARPTWPSRPRRQVAALADVGPRRGRPDRRRRGHGRLGRRRALRGVALGGPCRGHRRRGRSALRLPVVADPRAARRRRPRVPGAPHRCWRRSRRAPPRRSVSPARAIACSRCAPRTCR